PEYRFTDMKRAIQVLKESRKAGRMLAATEKGPRMMSTVEKMIWMMKMTYTQILSSHTARVSRRDVIRSCQLTLSRLLISTMGFHTAANPSFTEDLTDSQDFSYHVSASILAVSVSASTVSNWSVMSTMSLRSEERRVGKGCRAR